MTTKKLIIAFLLLSMALLAAGPSYAASLYFPHVDTTSGWQTEIAIINTSDQTITGTLKAFSNAGGSPVDAKSVTLAPHGRRQINVANEFTNHIKIGYIIFDADSDTVQGYTKFYIDGIYRVAIPAVKELNTGDIYIAHIDSSAQWWTGVSLVNTTAATKTLTIIFSDGRTRQVTLAANEHRAFAIKELFNNQPQPGIQSAVITNASGVVGLEIFGSFFGGSQLEGILLTDKTASTLYYPHLESNGWWTGIVAYNPSESACTITITPYSAQGTPLTPLTDSITGKAKYVGTVTALGLPSQTAWFKIDSTIPLSGFEVISSNDFEQLAAYAGNGGTGAKAGVFAKIEKSGWTSIALVNTEAIAASVTLTAYNDNGTPVSTSVRTIDGHAQVFNSAEALFPLQDTSSATYVAFSSDRNVVGFQINGSVDWTMLDGLPALINPFNTAPVANAGTNQYVVTGTLVTLDGSGSSDANGAPLTYSWTFSSIPNGSGAALSSATVAKPTFTPDVAGVYVLNLIVNDGQANSVADTVNVTASVANATLVNMVSIPAGSFQMGNNAGEGFSNELPVHSVTLGAFYLDKYEVTAALWDEVYSWAIAHGYSLNNASSGGYGSAEGSETDQPAHTISWHDVVKWLNARSEQGGKTPVYYTDAAQTTDTVYKTGQVDITSSMVKWQANGYRLPTEAEWEYATRAGTTTRYYTGSCISSDKANYDARAGWYGCPGNIGVFRGGPVPVGSLPANPWGLYDMEGNLWEWTWDRYDSYSSNTAINPRGPDSGLYRVIRGGGWYDGADDMRSAVRSSDAQTGGDRFTGFRSAVAQP